MRCCAPLNYKIPTRRPAARRDFEKYLAMEPQAEDRVIGQVVEELSALLASRPPWAAAAEAADDPQAEGAGATRHHHRQLPLERRGVEAALTSAAAGSWRRRKS